MQEEEKKSATQQLNRHDVLLWVFNGGCGVFFFFSKTGEEADTCSSRLEGGAHKNALHIFATERTDAGV